MKAINSFFTVVLLIVLAACGGGTGSRSVLQSGRTLSWQKVSVSSGATDVNSFAVSSSNHWFIADQNRGFYRSNDQGATWTAIRSPEMATRFGAIVQMVWTSGAMSRESTRPK